MIAFSPDGVTIASVSWRNTILLWDIRTRRPRLTFPQGSPITSIALSHDGLKLAIGRRDNYLAVINPENGRSLILPPIGFRNSAFRAFGCVAFSPDGFTLASGAGLYWYTGTIPIPVGETDDEMPVGKAILLWDTDSGKLLRTLTGHTDAVTSVAYSSSAPLLASGSCDKTVRLWDARTVSHLRTLKGHTDIVTSLVFAPTGSILASGSSDKTVRVWNSLTGEILHVLQGHTAPVTSVALAEDGSTLTSGSTDKTTKIWDIRSGENRWTFEHATAVISVAFSPDGRTVATGSNYSFDAQTNKTIRLWNVQTGKLVLAYEWDSPVSALAFTRDGLNLISGSGAESGRTNAIRIWDAHLSELE